MQAHRRSDHICRVKKGLPKEARSKNGQSRMGKSRESRLTGLKRRGKYSRENSSTKISICSFFTTSAPTTPDQHTSLFPYQRFCILCSFCLECFCPWSLHSWLPFHPNLNYKRGPPALQEGLPAHPARKSQLISASIYSQHSN